MKIGIIGCGFVGGALKNWLKNNNPDCELRISDPFKGYNDDVSDCDAYFIQIHLPTEDDGT
jgi:UDPglucose 6-dehydrogenase